MVQEQAPQNAGHTGYRIQLQVPEDKPETVVRNRSGRMVSVSVSILLLLVIPSIFLGFWGWFLWDGDIGMLGAIAGFSAGGEAVARIAPARMWVFNPEWTGYVTQNALRGKMVIYGPGFHPSHWWESRSKKGNWSLKVITRPFEVSIATSTSKVKIMGEYEYTMDLSRLDRAVGIDESTIEGGITAFIESFISTEVAKESADAARTQIPTLNGKLAEKFMEHEHEKHGKLETFGHQYGFKTVSVVVKNVALSDKVQAVRDAKDEVSLYPELIAEMQAISIDELRRRRALKKDDPEHISNEEYNKMLNRAMASSENATMTVHVIEADPGALAAQAAITLASGKGGQS